MIFINDNINDKFLKAFDGVELNNISDERISKSLIREKERFERRYIFLSSFILFFLEFLIYISIIVVFSMIYIFNNGLAIFLFISMVILRIFMGFVVFLFSFRLSLKGEYLCIEV